ncbi:MAG: tRNA lysidine(34) synthetase TilS [marine benthic group bacterium]|nr:tRNA lysidine(34) synthetase TilS [Gemmatimonadota bacterium]MCL7967544.1 tRNA lysidine(34) synthetase TilS [Gemmatimonadota bacterium]
MTTTDLDLSTDSPPAIAEMLEPGSRVLVAYSGGPDSTALLYILARLGQATGLQVTAAHFDHGVRPGSAKVAERCGRVCARLGIPFHTGLPDRPLAARHAELREARYRFLARIAREERISRIATAHQADDQAETVLMRILRGTGPRGLAGIPNRRGAIVRPLLGLRRAEITNWLDREGIEYEIDPANFDPRWARVRVRESLLPTLGEALGRDPVPLLLEVADAASRADRLMTLAGSSLLDRSLVPEPRTDHSNAAEKRPAALSQVFSLETFRSASRLEQAEALRLWARRRGIILPGGGTRSAVEFIRRGRSGGYVEPTRGLRVSRSFDALTLAAGATLAPDRVPFVDAELQLGPGGGQEQVSIADRSFRVRWQSGPAAPDSTSLGGTARGERVALAVGREHYPLLLRGWRPGDRVTTPAGTRKLKKLFGERSVPLGERSRIPVLVDCSGRVVWVPGLVTASWARPESTGADLVLEIADV